MPGLKTLTWNWWEVRVGRILALQKHYNSQREYYHYSYLQRVSPNHPALELERWLCLQSPFDQGHFDQGLLFARVTKACGFSQDCPGFSTEKTREATLLAKHPVPFGHSEVCSFEEKNLVPSWFSVPFLTHNKLPRPGSRRDNKKGLIS